MNGPSVFDGAMPRAHEGTPGSAVVRIGVVRKYTRAAGCAAAATADETLAKFSVAFVAAFASGNAMNPGESIESMLWPAYRARAIAARAASRIASDTRWPACRWPAMS